MKKLVALFVFLSVLTVSACGGGNAGVPATPFATEIESVSPPALTDSAPIAGSDAAAGGTNVSIPQESTETEAPSAAPGGPTETDDPPTAPGAETENETAPTAPTGAVEPEAPPTVPTGPSETEAAPTAPSGPTETETAPTAPTTQEGEQDGCVILMQGGAKVPCYSSHSLTKTTYEVTRAVIMIHGTDRNAEDYFGTALGAAKLAGKARETIVIAPHFKSTDDSANADELQWSSSGWKVGNNSVVKAGLNRASSFAVIDRLIESLSNRAVFPSLKNITITGHSAGGQFTQRYAAGTEVDLGRATYNFKYVVANPGSYMYLNEYRPYTPDNSQFTVPQTSCSYNDYKYGLQDKNAYMNLSPNTEIVSNYSSRRVVYLLGTKDTSVDSNLDTSCAATLQGANRYARGRNYMSYMNYFYSSNNHSRVDVTGVGHSRSGMYNSSAGINALFN